MKDSLNEEIECCLRKIGTQVSQILVSETEHDYFGQLSNHYGF